MRIPMNMGLPFTGGAMVVLLVAARLLLGRLSMKHEGYDPPITLKLLGVVLYLAAILLPPFVIFTLTRHVCVVRDGTPDTYEASILLGGHTVDLGGGRTVKVSSFSYPEKKRTAIVNATHHTEELREVHYGRQGIGGGTSTLVSIPPGEVAYIDLAVPNIDLGGSPGTVQSQYFNATRFELVAAGP